MDRREFLQKSLLLGGGLTLESMLLSCATIGIGHKEDSPVIYPRLRGHKIQPPENGCLIGFFRHYRHTNPRFPSGVDTDSGRPIEYYGKEFGRNPAFLVLSHNISIFSRFPKEDAVNAASRGVTPFIFAETSPQSSTMKGRKLEDIANGVYDNGAREFAKGAKEFGEHYGGYFLTTMWEMNIDYKSAPWVWCDQPKSFKKAWQHLWHIFEETGANQYTTWVIEYYVGFRLDSYYPGDKYVDWIGLSAYNRAIYYHSSGYRYLKDLISTPLHYFQSKHSEKPVIISEFASTVGEDQPNWLRNAYHYIRSKPGIKAAAYWDSVNFELGDNHTLMDESIIALKEILKDSYFIMAKQ